MRKVLASLALAAILLAGVAGTHNAGGVAHANGYNKCDSVTWTNRTGSGQYFSLNGVGQITLQAEVAILVDYNDHGWYCGEVKAQAHDTLWTGCFTIGGDAEVWNPHSTGSVWSQYHCTDQEYDITGPAWFLSSCLNGQTIYGYTNDGHGDVADSGSFGCDNTY